MRGRTPSPLDPPAAADVATITVRARSFPAPESGAGVSALPCRSRPINACRSAPGQSRDGRPHAGIGQYQPTTCSGCRRCDDPDRASPFREPRRGLRSAALLGDPPGSARRDRAARDVRKPRPRRQRPSSGQGGFSVSRPPHPARAGESDAGAADGPIILFLLGLVLPGTARWRRSVAENETVVPRRPSAPIPLEGEGAHAPCRPDRLPPPVLATVPRHQNRLRSDRPAIRGVGKRDSPDLVRGKRPLPPGLAAVGGHVHGGTPRLPFREGPASIGVRR
jgi:hypothetical protein